jgi:hypothetical protein
MNLQSRATTIVESSESGTYLQGAWLILARIAWGTLSILAVGLFVASLPSYFAYLHILDTSSSAGGPQLSPSDIRVLQRLGLSLDFYAWLDIGVNVIILLVFVMVGVVLFWRKSDDRVALLASFSLMLFPIAFAMQIVGTLPAVWSLPTKVIALLGNFCVALFFSLFPSGRFVPRWTRWLTVVWIAYWTINIFLPDSPISDSWFFVALFPGMVIFLIGLQIYRYRRVSNLIQRQQTKWVVAGIAFAFGPLVIALTLEFIVLPHFFPLSPLVYTLLQWPFDLLLLLFPLSLGFAILRYRLWDIDVLVNRTLVYGTLTIFLGLIYAGLVIGLQFLLGGFISQTNNIAIVASTLAIAALFQPLRHYIQRIIDRRFYRRKYDAARTLATFSATLRNEVDLNQLREDLVGVVQETMQPAHISLWLRKPDYERKSPADG